jgi:hypothetical protein
VVALFVETKSAKCKYIRNNANKPAIMQTNPHIATKHAKNVDLNAGADFPPFGWSGTPISHLNAGQADPAPTVQTNFPPFSHNFYIYFLE